MVTILQWLHERRVRCKAHTLRPRLTILQPVPPEHAAPFPVDPRLLAMFDRETDDGIKSWSQLIAWLETRATDLRTKRDALAQQLELETRFSRYRP